MSASKRGRKPKPESEKFSVTLYTRFTRDQADAINKAAAQDQRPVSDWLRIAVLKILEAS